MRSNDSSHDNDNGSESDEDSTLDVVLHCGECGVQLTLTLDTPIGLGGAAGLTPVPLCSKECVETNVERIAEVWDRCSCGAVVGSRDFLKTSRRGIIGCRACAYSGRLTNGSGVRHYWAGSGGALCTPPGESSRGLQATIRRSQVNCAACLHALMVEGEIARSQRSKWS